MVYVLNKDGQPLMPTNRHGKVRHLLQDGKAKIINRCPFTIQLLHNSTNYTQPITLGVDEVSISVYRQLQKVKNYMLLMQNCETILLIYCPLADKTAEAEEAGKQDIENPDF